MTEDDRVLAALQACQQLWLALNELDQGRGRYARAIADCEQIARELVVKAHA